MANEHELDQSEQSIRDAPVASEANNMTPEEAFDDLMSKMHTQRPIFFEIMQRCEAPMAASDIDGIIDDMQKNNASVYAAATLCTILEKAQALAKVNQDGSPFVDEEAEPDIITIDGIEFYKPSEPHKVYWLSTDLAKEQLAANKPADRLSELLDEEEAYISIYQRVLEMAKRENGATAEQLAEAIDSDPLLQKPRYYAPRFVNKLEQCEAIEWRGAWFLSAVGEACLDRIKNRVNSQQDANE